jgi:AbrB family looped-hinge helix DNA binding protein
VAVDTSLSYAILEVKAQLLAEDTMSLVKVRTNGQVTLPSSLRERAKLKVGDLVEAKLVKGKITLTPASLIDRHIAESQEQINNGQFYGPFDTAEEMIESLHRNGKKSKRPVKRSARR